VEAQGSGGFKEIHDVANSIDSLTEKAHAL